MPTNAAAELRAKIRLERTLSKRMRSFFASMARSIQQSLGPVGGSMIPSFEPWRQPLASLLFAHYGAVARTIAGGLSRAMPDDLKPADLERRVIAIEMGRVFFRRADAQAKTILDTAQRRLIRSVARATAAIAVPESGFTAADLPRLTARDWLRRQVVQARAVAAVETQMAAETAKGIEANRLLGESAPVEKAQGEAFKVWVTQGDSRVRTPPKSQFDHLEADGQRVRVSEAFEVSGEFLRWPGDWSLGASGGNIYNCRCSAVYEADSVADLRRSFLEQILLDLERFPQTESDVVVSVPFML